MALTIENFKWEEYGSGDESEFEERCAAIEGCERNGEFSQSVHRDENARLFAGEYADVVCNPFFRKYSMACGYTQGKRCSLHYPLPCVKPNPKENQNGTMCASGVYYCGGSRVAGSYAFCTACKRKVSSETCTWCTTVGDAHTRVQAQDEWMVRLFDFPEPTQVEFDDAVAYVTKTHNTSLTVPTGVHSVFDTSVPYSFKVPLLCRLGSTPGHFSALFCRVLALASYEEEPVQLQGLVSETIDRFLDVFAEFSELLDVMKAKGLGIVYDQYEKLLDLCRSCFAAVANSGFGCFSDALVDWAKSAIGYEEWVLPMARMLVSSLISTIMSGDMATGLWTMGSLVLTTLGINCSWIMKVNLQGGFETYGGQILVLVIASICQMSGMEGMSARKFNSFAAMGKMLLPSDPSALLDSMPMVGAFLSGKRTEVYKQRYPSTKDLIALLDVHFEKPKPHIVREAKRLYRAYLDETRDLSPDEKRKIRDIMGIVRLPPWFSAHIVNPRVKPVTIFIHGKTRVGKTKGAGLMAKRWYMLLKAKGLIHPNELYNDAVYVVPSMCKHWDGFNGQKIIIVDDWLSKIETLGAENAAGEIILRLSNNCPYGPPMADILDKSIMAEPIVIIVTCNTAPQGCKSLMDTTMMNADAVMARFEYIFEATHPDYDDVLHQVNGNVEAGLQFQRYTTWDGEKGSKEHWSYYQEILDKAVCAKMDEEIALDQIGSKEDYDDCLELLDLVMEAPPEQPCLHNAQAVVGCMPFRGNECQNCKKRMCLMCARDHGRRPTHAEWRTCLVCNRRTKTTRDGFCIECYYTKSICIHIGAKKGCVGRDIINSYCVRCKSQVCETCYADHADMPSEMTQGFRAPCAGCSRLCTYSYGGVCFKCAREKLAHDSLDHMIEDGCKPEETRQSEELTTLFRRASIHPEQPDGLISYGNLTVGSDGKEDVWGTHPFGDFEEGAGVMADSTEDEGEGEQYGDLDYGDKICLQGPEVEEATEQPKVSTFRKQMDCAFEKVADFFYDDVVSGNDVKPGSWFPKKWWWQKPCEGNCDKKSFQCPIKYALSNQVTDDFKWEMHLHYDGDEDPREVMPEPKLLNRTKAFGTAFMLVAVVGYSVWKALYKGPKPMVVSDETVEIIEKPVVKNMAPYLFCQPPPYPLYQGAGDTLHDGDGNTITRVRAHDRSRKLVSVYMPTKKPPDQSVCIPFQDGYATWSLGSILFGGVAQEVYLKDGVSYQGTEIPKKIEDVIFSSAFTTELCGERQLEQQKAALSRSIVILNDSVRAFAITGQELVTCTHLVKSLEPGTHSINVAFPHSNDTNRVIRCGNWKKFVKGEFCVIWCQNSVGTRSHFGKLPVVDQESSVVLKRFDSVINSSRSVVRLTPVAKSECKFGSEFGTRSVKVDIASHNGDCGSVYYDAGTTEQARLVGMHFAGRSSANEGFYFPLSKAAIQEARKTLGITNTLGSPATYDKIDLQGEPARTIQENFGVQGKVDHAVYVPKKSCLVKVPGMAKDKNEDWKDLYGVAVLGNVKTEEGSRPVCSVRMKEWKKNRDQRGDLVVRMSEETRDVMVDQFSAACTKQDFLPDYNTSIRSDPELGIAPMDRSKSGGWELRSHPKGAACDVTQEEPTYLPVVLENACVLEDRLAKGEEVAFTRAMITKDEKLPQAKVDSCRTRVFAPDSFMLYVLSKKFFASTVRFFSQDLDQLGFMNNKNPEEIAAHFVKYKDKAGMGVDYTNLDNSHTVGTVLDLTHVCVQSGVWDNSGEVSVVHFSLPPLNRVNRIRYELLMHMCCGNYVYEDLLFTIPGALASGCVLTTVLNMFRSYCVYLEFVLSLAVEMGQDFGTVAQRVHPLLFGDDGVVVLKDVPAEYRSACVDLYLKAAESYGMQLQAAKKGQKLEVEDIEDQLFCGRFLTETEEGPTMALEPCRIVKAVQFTKVNALVQNYPGQVLTFLQETARHSGETKTNLLKGLEYNGVKLKKYTRYELGSIRPGVKFEDQSIDANQLTADIREWITHWGK